MPISNELPALAMPIVTTTYETVETIPSNFMRRFARACVRCHRVQNLIRELNPAIQSFPDFDETRYLV